MGRHRGGQCGLAMAARPGRRVIQHDLEHFLVRAAFGASRGLSRAHALNMGAAVGALAYRLGIRARVARENLARAFPEWSAEQREETLKRHYAELGRVALEYASLAELVRAPLGEVLIEVVGIEHLERARGRGAILLSGHFGNFEFEGARLGQMNPVDFVVRPLSNPRVEEEVRRLRAGAGVGTIDAGSVREVYRAIRAGRWVAMLADQDARRQGIFVPFLGTPASTVLGPARIALATGAPIIMGFDFRQEDGRHVLEVQPPLEAPDPASPDAAETLTRRHVEVLEQMIRRRPEAWFWLHRRWKTRPA